MTKKEITVIIIALLIISLITGIFIFNKKITPSQFIQKITPQWCNSDSDCMKVSILGANKCCTGCGVEAISKDTEIKRNQWQKANCQGNYQADHCPIYDCLIEANSLTMAACVQHQCELVEIKTVAECDNDVYCLLELASKTGERNICEKIKTISSGCTKNVWSGQKRKQVPYYNEYFDCLVKVAEKNEDRSLCDSLDSIISADCSTEEQQTTFRPEVRLDLKNYCFSSAAQNIDDCRLIPINPRNDFKDKCYETFAKNPADCQLITDDYTKNKCLANKAESLRDCLQVNSEKTEKDPNDYKQWCIIRNHYVSNPDSLPPASIEDCNITLYLKETGYSTTPWTNCINSFVKSVNQDFHYKESCNLLKDTEAIKYCLEQF